jgi:hypothetical protein
MNRDQKPVPMLPKFQETEAGRELLAQILVAAAEANAARRRHGELGRELNEACRQLARYESLQRFGEVRPEVEILSVQVNQLTAESEQSPVRISAAERVRSELLQQLEHSKQEYAKTIEPQLRRAYSTAVETLAHALALAADANTIVDRIETQLQVHDFSNHGQCYAGLSWGLIRKPAFNSTISEFSRWLERAQKFGFAVPDPNVINESQLALGPLLRAGGCQANDIAHGFTLHRDLVHAPLARQFESFADRAVAAIGGELDDR